MNRYKNLAFKNECGGCGVPLRRNSNNKTGYLCHKCRPYTNMRPDAVKHSCSNCPFEMDCTIRVQLGIWIRCEIPDIADIERLKFSGGLDDEDVRRELEKSLEGSGNRKVLEEAVSKSAAKIYQGYLEGSKREMPIGIRK